MTRQLLPSSAGMTSTTSALLSFSLMENLPWIFEKS